MRRLMLVLVLAFPPLAADDRFFAEYRRLIATGALGPSEARRRVAQSLRYAAFAKLHTAVAGATSEEDSR